MGCHVSHTYHAGASLYFTFGFVPGRAMGWCAICASSGRPKSFLVNGATPLASPCRWL